MRAKRNRIMMPMVGSLAQPMISIKTEKQAYHGGSGNCPITAEIEGFEDGRFEICVQELDGEASINILVEQTLVWVDAAKGDFEDES